MCVRKFRALNESHTRYSLMFKHSNLICVLVFSEILLRSTVFIILFILISDLSSTTSPRMHRRADGTTFAVLAS